VAQRVMQRGFVQGDGGSYRPMVVRVSAGGAEMSPAVAEVEVGA
jgi:hypothetical protein